MRVGLLGLGAMGARHLAAYAQLLDVEVVTRKSSPYSSIDPKDSKLICNTMTDDPSLDAIDICLPTPLHRPVTLAALEAGRHVLCEKPMALNVDDCSAMLLAAQKGRRVFMVAHVLRFWPAYQVLAEAVRSCRYGPVQWARFTRSSSSPGWGKWLTRPEESGGATLDLLVHDFDQALAFFGQPDYATAIRIPSADAIECVLQYASGLRVEVVGGWFQDGRPFAMGFQVRTSEADLIFENDRLSLLKTGLPAQEIVLSSVDPYAEQLSYFLDCCRHDCAPIQSPPGSSMQAVELACVVEALAKKKLQTPQKISLSMNEPNSL